MSRVRAVLIAVLLGTLAMSVPVAAQGTIAPDAALQFFTNSAAVCASCELNVYTAGTSTRATTYSESTLTTANANPVILDSAGRAVVYLSPGTSYRFVLTNSGGGTTYWDRDPIQAVPSAAGNLDIAGTAGEALALGEVVYLAAGEGSTTAGRWYRMDADNTYSSSTAGMTGTATAAIASAASGTIRIAGRVTGLSGLTAGEFYYASATAGALTATPPANQRFIGEADTTTTLVMHGGRGALTLPDSDGTHTLAFITTSDLTADRRIAFLTGDASREITLSGDLNITASTTLNQDVSTTGAPTFATMDTGQGANELYDMDQNVLTTSAPTFATVDTGQGANELYDMDQNVLTTGTAPSFNAFRPPQGRCTLTSATPVTTSDVTAATTLYYALYGGNQITLYDGSARWVQTSFTELSIAVPATTTTMYDVFVDYTAGSPALEVVAWSSDTARATSLATQNGVYVQTSDTDSLYVCSFRTTGVSGTTEDSLVKRYVWNYYNRVPRRIYVIDATNSWQYETATWRQAGANAANQLDVVIGVAESQVDITVVAQWDNTNASSVGSTAIGVDSTTVVSGLINTNYNGAAGTKAINVIRGVYTPAIGRHFFVWLENGQGSTATQLWFGDNGSTNFQSGMTGLVEGM